MFCMHQQASKFIRICLQPEQNAQPDIINSTLHGSVHGFGVVIIIVFWARWMQFFILLLVIGFLEQDVCSNSSVMQFPVIFHCSCSDIHIDPANCSVFVLNVINGVNGFQNVFNGVVQGVFSSLQSQPFVSHILQRNDFSFDFLLRQFFSADMLVFRMIRAVNAAVHAVVGKIKRSK